MIKEEQKKFDFWGRIAVAIGIPALCLFGKKLVVMMGKESPELTEAREAYRAFLRGEKEDNKRLEVDFTELQHALSDAQYVQDRIKGAIAERVKAIRERMRIKSTDPRFFQQSRARPPLQGELEELKREKEAVWREFRCFSDPGVAGFIPAPRLPEGELTAVIIRDVHERRQARHGRKLALATQYLDVSVRVLEHPSVELHTLDAAMKKAGVSLPATPGG